MRAAGAVLWLIAILLLFLVLVGDARASDVTLDDAVWEHLERHNRVVVRTDCILEVGQAATCTARFNTRRQACVRTFTEAPFRAVTARVCHDRKWRIPTMSLEDFEKGVTVTIGTGR